jgi:hypothetical protein
MTSAAIVPGVPSRSFHTQEASHALVLPVLSSVRSPFSPSASLLEPLVIDARAHDMLRSYFDKTNRMLPCSKWFFGGWSCECAAVTLALASPPSFILVSSK